MELRLLFAWTLGKPTCLVDVPRYLPRIQQVGCLGRIEFRLMVRGDGCVWNFESRLVKRLQLSVWSFGDSGFRFTVSNLQCCLVLICPILGACKNQKTLNLSPRILKP